MATNNPTDYFTLVACSASIKNMGDSGYISKMVNIQAFSCINVACSTADFPVVLTIETNNQPNDTASNKTFFSTDIETNVPFFKRFIMPNNFFRVKVLPKTTPLPELGTQMHLNTSVNAQNQFSAFTFLNSPIDINADTNLIRTGNDFNVDLIRNLHTGFSKVNIQGVQKTLPAAGVEETIGLGRNFTLNTGACEQVVANAADDPAGTGARSLRYIGILSDGTAFNSNFTSGVGTGTLGLNIRTVNRAVVSATGTGLKNAGDITVQTTAGSLALSKINAGENVSHVGIYGVETSKRLVLTDVNICGRSDAEGVLKVIEMNSTGMEFVLGEFLINSSYQQITYRLDGLVELDSIIKLNFHNTSAIGTGNININVNVNGMLCPIKNSF